MPNGDLVVGKVVVRVGRFDEQRDDYSRSLTAVVDSCPSGELKLVIIKHRLLLEYEARMGDYVRYMQEAIGPPGNADNGGEEQSTIELFRDIQRMFRWIVSRLEQVRNGGYCIRS